MPELEERQAKIEDTLEQLEKRVGRLEVELTEFRSEIRNELTRLEGKIDTNFRWLVGMWVTTWITTMLAILGLYFKG